jgi:photosystem II stability/assembly factor-like uncharacterized protein
LITIISASATAATFGWVVGNTGTILNTNNGGNIWSSQASGTAEELLGVTSIDTTTGWAVGEGGTILYTTDGGTTWVSQTSGTTTNIEYITFTDANTGWAVGGWRHHPPNDGWRDNVGQPDERND